MKWNGFIILSLLDTCMGAQKWKLIGCENYNKDQLKGGVKEAVTLAGSALDVLNNNFGDEKVQKMVKHILGDDQNLQGRVDRAKGNVKRYDEEEAAFLGAPFIDNDDVLIFCDYSNYEHVGGRTRNKASGGPIPKEAAETLELCHKGNPAPGSQLPMAVTLSSDGLDRPRWQAVFDEWKRNGGPQPDMAPYAVPQPTKPNTMDLCTWFLNTLGNGGFTSIDDPTIARVQEQSFLDGLTNNDKAIDGLVQSLAGTFLHELTHTNLGGKTVDNPASTGCYGWVCVGNLHDVNNADSIAHLGVCMHLFTKGLWVDEDGKVQKI